MVSCSTASDHDGMNDWEDDGFQQFEHSGPPTPRSKQFVAKVADKRRCVSWMVSDVEANGERCLPSRAIRKFPDLFSGTRNAQLVKATRWWKERDIILSDNAPITATRWQNGAERRYERKVVVKGRGRKRSAWAQWLHGVLLDEFTRYSKAGVHFTTPVLQNLASHLIQNNRDNQFNSQYLDPADQRPIIEKITASFIQQFCEAHGIIAKLAYGRSRLSDKKETYIKKTVSYHLGEVSRAFSSGLLHPDHVHNMDETHLILDMSKPRYLGFRGQNVKLTELVQGSTTSADFLR